MVHVKVLVVVVLCSSCFVQDALSAAGQTGPTRQTGPIQRQTSGKRAAPLPGVADWLNAATAPVKAATAPARAAAMPAKLAASAKAVAARAKGAATPAARAVAGPRQQAAPVSKKRRSVAVPAPPPKYPALAELTNAYFDTWERVNRANEPGKVVMRDVRNILSDGLTSPGFWTAVAAMVGQVAKWTNDERKAELHVHMCDANTDALTRPGAARAFEDRVGHVYEAAARLDLAPYAKRAHDVAATTVDHDEALAVLDQARAVVDAVRLDPAMVKKAFGLFNLLLNSAGLVKNDNVVSNAITNGVTKLGIFLNRNANK